MMWLLSTGLGRITIVTKMSAGDYCIIGAPIIVTNSPPLVVIAHLHPPLAGGGAWSGQTDVSSGTAYS